MTALLFFKYFGLQLVIALILLVVGFGIDGRDGVLAAGLGCAIAIFPNVYFTFQAFRYKANEDPVKAFSALYRGEVGKIILVMVLCALCFHFYELHNPLLLFIALFVILLTQAIASVIVFSALEVPQDLSQIEETDK